MNSLKEKFEYTGLVLKAIYSDMDADTLQLEKLVSDSSLKIPITLDKELKLAKQFNISTTPQVVLIDSLNKILYSGMLDDYFYALGKHRTLVSNKYLENAIEAILKGEKIKTQQTTPIGCKINYNYSQ
jgi:hypothetical protein